MTKKAARKAQARKRNVKKVVKAPKNKKTKAPSKNRQSTLQKKSHDVNSLNAALAKM
jgi:hypothetical protein